MTIDGRDDGPAFVGRADLVNDVIGQISHAADPAATHTWGPQGIGKTTLLGEVRRRLLSETDALVLHVDAAAYVPDARPGSAADLPLRHLHANFRQFVDLLSQLCVDHHDLARETALIIESARLQIEASRCMIDFAPRVSAKGTVSAATSGAVASLFVNEADRDTEIATRLLEQVDRITSVFLDQLAMVAPRKGVAILIDNLDRLDGHPVGVWVGRLALRSAGAVAVLTSTDDAPPLGAAERDVRSVRLPRLKPEEVSRYVRDRLGPDATEELVAAVEAASRGLPFVVALAVADLLQDRAERGQEVTLDDAGDDVAALFSVVLREANDPDVRRLLRDGRLARRIDRGVVQWLLSGSDGPQERDEWERAGRVLKRLTQYSFVQPVDGAVETYTFHALVRRTVNSAKSGATVDSDAVHRRLADLWLVRRQRLAESDSAAPTSYAGWYVHERPEWQRTVLEWLFHTGQLSSLEDRQQARLELAELFLTMFWWFGCYVRLDFCATLLSNWEESQPQDDKGVVRLLREVLAHYPLGWDKTQGGGWLLVRQALHQLRLTLGLPSDVASASPLQRLVRGLSTLFIAHSYRYTPGGGDVAVKLCDDALHWLGLETSPVLLSWMLFERADLAIELGRWTEAEPWARKALAQALTEVTDHELLANLHRIRATVALHGDRPSQVGRELAGAVLRAYLALMRPHPPDLYTVTFFREVRERTVLLLLEVGRSHGDAAAREAAQELVRSLADWGVPLPAADAELVAAAFATGEPDAVADVLLPPCPSLDDEALLVDLEAAVSVVEVLVDVDAEFAPAHG